MHTISLIPVSSFLTTCFLISVLPVATTESIKTRDHSVKSSITADQAASFLRNALRQAPGQLIGRIRPGEIDAYRAWIAKQNSESDQNLNSDGGRNVPDVEPFSCENLIIPVSITTFF